MTAIHQEDRTGKVAFICGGITILIGMVGIIGAATDSILLTSILPGWPRMAFLTALNFVMAGVSLSLSLPVATGARGKRSTSVHKWLSRIFALALLFISALQLLGFTWPSHAVPPESHALGATFDGTHAVMAPATAINFLMVGSALLINSVTSFSIAFQSLSIAIGLSAWLATSRYFYGGEPLAFYANCALTTSLAFLVLSVGLLCARKDAGLMRLYRSGSSGGLMLRRIAPYAVLLPVILGWLRLQGQHLGWYGTEAGLSIFTVANVLVFGAVVWINAIILDRSDTERRRLEKNQLRLSAIVESSEDAIIAKNLDGIILTLESRGRAALRLQRRGSHRPADADLHSG